MTTMTKDDKSISAKKPSSKSVAERKSSEIKDGSAEWAAARLEALMMARLGLGDPPVNKKKRKSEADTTKPSKSRTGLKPRDDSEEPTIDENEEWIGSDDASDSDGHSQQSEHSGPYANHAIDDMRSDDDEWDGEYDDNLEEGSDSGEEEAGVQGSIEDIIRDASGPEVVEFKDPTRNRAASSNGTKGAQRAFMSSSIKKLNSDGKPTKPLSKEDEELEKEDDQHDRDLMDLLQTTKLIEEYNEDQLAGADRRRHMFSKLEGLGVKSAKPKAPRAVRYGMEQKEKERGQKRLQEAKDLGTYHANYRTQIMGEAGVKEKATNLRRIKDKVKERSRGIAGDFGKFRNGTLHLSKDEIAGVEKQAAKVRGKSRGRGRGGSSGGGRGGGGSSGGRGGGSSRGRGGGSSRGRGGGSSRGRGRGRGS